MNRLGLYVREARAEIWRALRMPEFAVPTLALPLLFYVMFALVLAPPGSGNGSYLLATYGVFAALGPALFGFGAGVGNDRETGLLALKQVSPLPVSAYLCARLAVALLFTLMVLLPLYALAALVAGVVLPGSAWLQLLAVHAASVLPFGLLGLAIGLTLRSAGALAVSNLLFLLLALLGGLWMPAFLFPDWLQQLGALLPSSHLAALALAAVGRAPPTSLAGHAAAALAATLLFAACAVVAWRRAAP